MGSGLSSSQTSPIPSPSLSAWLGFGVSLQLSIASFTPSPSVSFWETEQPVSSTTAGFSTKFPSEEESWLLIVSVAPAVNKRISSVLGVLGQRSTESGMPSSSVSFWLNEHPSASTSSSIGVLAHSSVMSGTRSLSVSFKIVRTASEFPFFSPSKK